MFVSSGLGCTHFVSLFKLVMIMYMNVLFAYLVVYSLLISQFLVYCAIGDYVSFNRVKSYMSILHILFHHILVESFL